MIKFAMWCLNFQEIATEYKALPLNNEIESLMISLKWNKYSINEIKQWIFI